LNVDDRSGLDREVAADDDRDRMGARPLDDIGRQDREIADEVEAGETDRADGGRERERTTVELRGIAIRVARDRSGDRVDRDRRGVGGDGDQEREQPKRDALGGADHRHEASRHVPETTRSSRFRRAQGMY